MTDREKATGGPIPIAPVMPSAPQDTLLMSSLRTLVDNHLLTKEAAWDIAVKKLAPLPQAPDMSALQAPRDPFEPPMGAHAWQSVPTSGPFGLHPYEMGDRALAEQIDELRRSVAGLSAESIENRDEFRNKIDTLWDHFQRRREHIGGRLSQHDDRLTELQKEWDTLRELVFDLREKLGKVYEGQDVAMRSFDQRLVNAEDKIKALIGDGNEMRDYLTKLRDWDIAVTGPRSDADAPPELPW